MTAGAGFKLSTVNFKLIGMRSGTVNLILTAALMLLAVHAWAQEPPAQPVSGTLDAALGVEDPTERIAALRKFLRTNIIPEQSQTAREAIVASYAQIGESRLSENEIEKAVAAFRNALGAIPEKASDRLFETTIVRIPQAVSLRGYRADAIGLARALEERYRGEPARLSAIGEFYLGIEAPGDAARALEAAIAANPDDARSRRSLGAAYRMGLRLDEAVAEYQQAVRIDPADKRAYYELGNLYRAHGAYEDAIRLYRRQLEIDPKFLASYKGMALALLSLGREDQALSALNQARDLRGSADEIRQDIYLQTQLAFCYLKQRNFRAARQAADAAIAVEPRYAWARIAAAEIDMAEEKFFDAERNLLAAQKYAGFPTLLFTLGKLYVAVEDFDGAVEQFSRVFSYTGGGTFSARLGGALDLKAGSLKELLSREHQAALFMAESPTTDEAFRIIESLVVFNENLRKLKSAAGPRIARADAGVAVNPAPEQVAELDKASADFIGAENFRKAFRALYIARQLSQAGVGASTAAELADQVLSLAGPATEPEGSLRDYPNLDREGRLRVMRGRAFDAKGWALYKAGRSEEAAAALVGAVDSYGPLPEGRQALRHLAAVKESLGETALALDLYIAGYEVPAGGQGLDLNRTVIEMIYRKLNNGSLEGLDERLRIAASDENGRQLQALLARLIPSRRTETAGQPVASATGEQPAKAPAERRGLGLRFLTPYPPAPREPRVDPGPAPRPAPKSEEKRPAVSTDDPMFARNSRPPAPEPPRPVRLPVLAPEPDFSMPLNPPFNQLAFYSKWDGFLSKFELEPPPEPAPKPHTRKRRVTVPDGPPGIG